VAGDGPWRNHYERGARHLGDRVQFLGRVFDDRAALYGSADLYLCPTTRASFGVTLLEAMACGAPLVLADNVGFRAVVRDGVEAVIVPNGDPAMWADTAIALLENPARRDAMTRCGLATASRFAWPRIADQTLDIYERVTR
jgi:phosphatidylinositol alpha-mannosyltransferase